METEEAPALRRGSQHHECRLVGHCFAGNQVSEGEGGGAGVDGHAHRDLPG